MLKSKATEDPTPLKQAVLSFVIYFFYILSLRKMENAQLFITSVVSHHSSSMAYKLVTQDVGAEDKSHNSLSMKLIKQTPICIIFSKQQQKSVLRDFQIQSIFEYSIKTICTQVFMPLMF